METVGNFLSQSNKDFPLDCETLASMQANTALIAAIGNIAGDRLILTGCELSSDGTRREKGYLFVRTKDFPQGEVLCWEGGVISGGMYVKLEDVTVNAQGYEYPKAYTKRTLAAGVGSEHFNWADFKKPKTSAELDRQITELSKQQAESDAKFAGEPLGVVKMWAGVKVPENYALCDGAMLKTSEYPELFKAIGTAFNFGMNYNGTRYNTQNGFFRLPDLRGRFVVGYNDIDDEYKNYGNVGGEKKHALTIDEMPSHSHNYTIYTRGSKDRQRFAHKNNCDSDTDETRSSAPTGGGLQHENRPPFYTLAYIMKVR